VQLQTNLGNLNFEIHCDWAPRTSWNFITLCERGYYNESVFHRLIPGFMVQGGDPSGSGSGGTSAFGKPFRDEFDNRIYHDKRGVLSMANSGSNTNSSQFFITFQAQPHLNLKHSVFGRLVGGNAVLDRIEAVGVGAKDAPAQEIKILNVHVMTSPLVEANELLIAMIKENMAARLSSQVKSCLHEEPTRKIESSASAAGATHPPTASPRDVVERAPIPSKVGHIQNAAVSTAVGGGSEADRVAAFLRSQGLQPEDLATREASEPSYKKKKVGGSGFSNW
jgi:peptidyl-prolyl cis-trans isomerase-like protein 2